MADVMLSRSIANDWNMIRKIRGEVGGALSGHPEELRVAAMMTGSELLENAVKYGEPIASAEEISFDLRLVGGVLQLSTVSGSKNLGNVARLEATIHRIAGAADPMALLESVLMQMLEDPSVSPGGGIGLYRIAAEGRFTLACDCRDQLVRVQAHRGIR